MISYFFVFVFFILGFFVYWLILIFQLILSIKRSISFGMSVRSVENFFEMIKL